MGLRTWPNANIRKSDAIVSKNYLGAAEVKELNRLTTILLDIFEDQMDLGRLATMRAAADLLDSQLSGLGRSVLRGGGRVSMLDAKKHAEREYAKFKAAQTQLRHEQADSAIAAIRSAENNLRRSKKPK
jgi:hypothetical protein